MPLISVILPVYNGEEYLPACLESLGRQTLQDIEIIAVNNASTDNSAKILREYENKDSRLKIIEQDPNVGPGGARNVAMKYTVGDYLAFCDCDDTVPEDAYHWMYEKAQEMDADVVVADYEEDIDGKVVYHRICSPRKSAFVVCEMGAMWNKLYRREFLVQNQLQFRQELHVDEDLLFLAQILGCHPQYALLEKSVYLYRRVADKSDSLSKLTSLDAIKSNIAARTEYIRIISALGYQSASDLSFYSFRYVFRKWCAIAGEEERREALRLIQDFVEQECSWDKSCGRFMVLLGMRPDEFSGADYMEFLYQHYKYCFYRVSDDEESRSHYRAPRGIAPEEQTEDLFKSGKLGFRYIWKYTRKWFGFKLECLIRGGRR